MAMSIDRIAASSMTLYSEVLEQALLVERQLNGLSALPGSLTTKSIGDRKYLYWQVSVGTTKKQEYLGPDTPELRRAIDEAQERRKALEPDLSRLDRMAKMLTSGGLLHEPSSVGTVIDLFASFGFFRRGAQLVGTQAFRTYGNLLGIHLHDTLGRTQDIDLAHDLQIATAANADERSSSSSPPILDELKKLDFLPVPDLHPGAASVSYKVRGQDLRVDFLTSQRGTKPSKPVAVPGLGVHAQPLRFMDYLLGGGAVPALILWSRTTLVRVPDPARFALHKLWTAAERHVGQQAKANKDRRQAAALLEVLVEERPASLQTAWSALEGRSGKTAIRAELKKLPSETIQRLGFKP
jgi:hypothetical protein